MTTSSSPTAIELAERRTRLAFERTRVAAERTMMAWIRTSLSMIGFGFTLFKFFEYLEVERLPVGSLGRGPRNLGVVLTVLGTVVLLAAALQHRRDWKRLYREAGRQPERSLAFATAMLMMAIGVGALMNLLFQVGPI